MDATPQFRFELIADRGAIPVLALAGEVDIHSSSQVQRALRGLIDDGARQIVVDAGAVTFMDSTGLGVLVSCQRRLQRRGGAIVISAPEPITRLLEIAGLERIFAVCATREEGLRTASARATPAEGQR